MSAGDRRAWIGAFLSAVPALCATACGDDGGSENTAQNSESNGVEVGARVVDITPERFFPEGVAVDKDGNFYIGSMDLGAIYRATAS